MRKTEFQYYCRLGYLYLIDNIEKYKDEEGNIDHILAMNDFIKDENLRKEIIGYINFIWNVHGDDKVFIDRIRKAVKRSVYAKVS